MLFLMPYGKLFFLIFSTSIVFLKISIAHNFCYSLWMVSNDAAICKQKCMVWLDANYANFVQLIFWWYVHVPGCCNEEFMGKFAPDFSLSIIKTSYLCEKYVCSIADLRMTIYCLYIKCSVGQGFCKKLENVIYHLLVLYRKLLIEYSYPLIAL